MTQQAQVTQAVIYARVSTHKQLAEGNGLSSQQVRCEQFAEHKGLEIINVFYDEGVSGSLVERRAMQAMLDFLKSKSTPIAVIVDDISRLARGLQAHIELRTTIDKAGGVLMSPSIEFGSSPDELLVENLMASVSQHFRDKNREQSINRTNARLSQGYYVNARAPVGYEYQNITGHGKLLVKKEPAARLVQDVLESFACGRFETKTEVKRYIDANPSFPKTKNNKITYDQVARLLNNVTYAGYIHMPKRGIHMVQAKHEAIISYETYLAIQKRLDGQAKAPARKDLHLEFPLRGFITCTGCGKPLTSSKSKGRTQYYGYYHCNRKPCPQYGKSVRADRVEDEFTKLLLSIKPSAEQFKIAQQALIMLWEQRRAGHKTNHSAVLTERNAVDDKIEKLVSRIIETESTTLISRYESSIQDLEKTKLELDEKIKQCGRPIQDFETSFRTAIGFFANPHKLWASEELSHKRTVLKLMFTERMPYDLKDGFRTAPIAQPYRLLDELQGGKYEMVRPSELRSPTSAMSSKAYVYSKYFTYIFFDI